VQNTLKKEAGSTLVAPLTDHELKLIDGWCEKRVVESVEMSKERAAIEREVNYKDGKRYLSSILQSE
jgi:hypothetical protein